VSRGLRVPAVLARCDFVPLRLPFAERYDLVFAFSVFTHISEAAHEASLRAIHTSLDPGGILIVTIRSPAYLSYSEAMHPLLAHLGPDRSRGWPSPATCSRPTRRARSLLSEDLDQVVLTLRRS
jgi:SAM-dependent methyltransferase